jgi:hypothetical protein
MTETELLPPEVKQQSVGTMWVLVTVIMAALAAIAALVITLVLNGLDAAGLGQLGVPEYKTVLGIVLLAYLPSVFFSMVRVIRARQK